MDLKKKLRNSLHNTWKNALVLDWIPEEKAKALSLDQYYVGLRWTRTVRALTDYKEELNSIFDIFNIIDNDEERRPVKIFIEGR